MNFTHKNILQKKYIVFVFANLKPSQINYKIIPLSNSKFVEKIYILRKKKLFIDNDKITCLDLPWLLRYSIFYWFFTAIYGVFCIKKFKANLILNYNIFPHGFNAYVASILSRNPVIFSEINQDTINYYEKKITKRIIYRILNHAKVICTPGRNTSNYWENIGFHKTVELHSTIDTSFFKPDYQIIKEYDFLYIGELDNNKRPDIILKSFYEIWKKFPDIRLCIIGYGVLENEIKYTINQLGLTENVFIIHTNNVLEYIQKSKIFVMASLSEGLPCAMIESMACELIVIVPNVGDISNVIFSNKNGFLHNNSDYEITSIMEDKFINFNILSNLREEARKTIVVNHSYEVASKKWDDLFRKMIG